ncbi:MAG: endopeptidase La [Clostridiales bacterium]|nr:endopeptidase La [Clostridiales bacterium]
MATKKMMILPLRGVVVFPNMTVNVEAVRKKAVSAVEEAMATDSLVMLVSQKDPNVKDPTGEDIFTVGTIAKIKQMLRLPGEGIRIVAQGITRGRVETFYEDKENFCGEVSEVEEFSEFELIEAEAHIRMVLGELEMFAKNGKKIPVDVINAVRKMRAPGLVADTVAAAVVDDMIKRQELLEALDPIDRLEKLFSFLNNENQILSIEQRVRGRVKTQMDKAQRDYYLHEQIKAIHHELGDTDESLNDELSKRIKASKMPAEVRKKAEKELLRMSKMPPAMPESSILRAYIETLVDLPWKKQSEDNLDLDNAKEILDRDHYGMHKVKERIIEYLAVRALSNSMRGPVICFVGPPGVGKTSIAKSIAEAVNRKFVRMSLGGLRDEAEIRGHRRTYVGAMPGRIISLMKQAGTVNPVFLFDEIDKMASDYKGDPASAMLEVLDPEQNNSFRDNFLEVPYDLSNVMFITTANSLEGIPGPLRDRMEIIELSSYTDVEKLHIAQRHLMLKQLKENGMAKGDVTVSDEAMLYIINNYTREAGVRSLERQIGQLLRKCACKFVKNGRNAISVGLNDLEELIGKPKYHRDDIMLENKVGSATGLAWTSIGGETLEIDVTVYSGGGELLLTGQLGDVMKESARTAFSLIRSRADRWNITPEFFKEKDFHIHIPEGATPKDGPSAGVTLFTSMVSAVTGIAVRGDTAMTGEITLRGRVLAIGGLKEKSLAAYRGGIRRIIIPKDNLRDIEDVPEEVRQNIEYIAVDNVDEVLDNILKKEN